MCPGISVKIGIGVNHNRSSSSWSQQKIDATFLFWGETSKITGGKLYNQVTGRIAEYLTVGGSAGSETYKATGADYITADTEYMWFDKAGNQRTVTTAELIGYDLQRTPVKYDDNTPNTIRIIAILKSTTTLSNIDLLNLHHYFRLPIMWSGGWIDQGYEKSNRSDNVQNIWTVEQSATIENAAKTHVVITFNHNLDAGSVPATSAFTLAGKTINNVAISGAVVTLTVTVAYVYGDSVTVAYTQPGSNPLKEATGEALIESFTGVTVVNNIAQTIPTISTATVETAAASNIVITFNNALNNSYVPATTDYAVLVNGSSRGVNTVTVAGTVNTLTLASPCANGDTISVSYTKPATNYLRDNTTGGAVATFSGHAVTNNIVVATSYANAGGAGDRHLIMSVSRAGFNDSGGTPIMPAIIDGHKNNDYATYWYAGGGSTFNVDSNSYITIDFVTAKSMNEVKIYINHAAYTIGTWKWQGSNNGTTFTDLTGNTTLQTHATNDYITDTSLSANSTAYRYYRMIGVSGTINNNVTMWWEMEFKISA
jgi:uncharacterized repeat protein (TIGR02059 family)